ncbi:ornithine cyclodeaminase family protein [Actinomadura madurae]|uniref:ornithine cyclodeaminase family protein n=2 Tax=Actinomadura madurae TaxID=1993 RepID=UPI002025E3D1|nr:ornithine cyclodeaminase family protein [Actinomadura madurae]URN07543.1 ornithine cyclodeaminase family protein [Actinomadura madurae]
MSAPQIFEAGAIRCAIGFEDLVDPVAGALAAFSRGLGASPLAVFAPAGPDGDVHVKSAWLPGRPVFTVKVAAWFAARAARGLPGGSGYVAVHDAATGDLLALLQDEHHLSDVRTAAAGALAARLLAPRDARTLAVLGTGVQAYLQALAAIAERPIDTVLVWGRRAGAARTLRAAISARAPRVTATVVANAREAVRLADVIVTATSSRRPIVAGSWLRPGQHVTAVGADDATKAELDPECFRRADLLVVDSRADAPVHAGDLRAALAAHAVTEAGIGAELGDLVPDGHARRSGTQITLAKLIGLGVQDLAAAETVLPRLTAATPPEAGAAPPASILDLHRTPEASAAQRETVKAASGSRRSE